MPGVVVPPVGLMGATATVSVRVAGAGPPNLPLDAARSWRGHPRPAGRRGRARRRCPHRRSGRRRRLAKSFRPICFRDSATQSSMACTPRVFNSWRAKPGLSSLALKLTLSRSASMNLARAAANWFWSASSAPRPAFARPRPSWDHWLPPSRRPAGRPAVWPWRAATSVLGIAAAGPEAAGGTFFKRPRAAWMSLLSLSARSPSSQAE